MPKSRYILISYVMWIFIFYRGGSEEGVRLRANDISTLINSPFNVNKTTVIATHGFLSDANQEWMQQMKTGLVVFFLFFCLSEQAAGCHCGKSVHQAEPLRGR